MEHYTSGPFPRDYVPAEREELPFEARPTRSRTIIAYLIVQLAAALFIGGLFWLALSVAARAHQAPLGWSYSASCCSQRDCAQLPEGAVKEGPDGYQITIFPGQHPMVKDKVLRVTIPYDSKKLRDSPDGLYHGCITPSLTFLCLYRGARGF